MKKKVVYNGVELTVGDMITPDYRNGVHYIIMDFEDGGKPIVVQIISNGDYNSGIPYPHEELYIIGTPLDFNNS